MNITQLYLKIDNICWIKNNIASYNPDNGVLESWTPNNRQEAILRDRSKYRLGICERRMGKTSIISNEALCNAIKKQNTECLIIVMNNQAARSMTSCIHEKVISSLKLHNEFDKLTQHDICFKNGSIIKVRAYGQIHDSNLRTCNFLYMDEVFYMYSPISSVLDYIIEMRPSVNILALGTPCGYMDITPTFKLFNTHHFYNIYNPLVSQQVVLNTRQDMPDISLRREWA